MKTVANVMLVSSKPDSFKGKDGSVISFQRVVLLQPGDEDTMAMTAPDDLDLSAIKLMQPFNAVIDVRKNYQGYPKLKLVGVQA